MPGQGVLGFACRQRGGPRPPKLARESFLVGPLSRSDQTIHSSEQSPLQPCVPALRICTSSFYLKLFLPWRSPPVLAGTVWCRRELEGWDPRGPPLFIWLTRVFFREDLIKRDHRGFVFCCIFWRERGQWPSLHLPALSVCILQSRCRAELRGLRFLMSCLLNHRPPDCVATVASLFKEETLIVHFFFHPENKHIRFFAGTMVFWDGCCFCYYYCLWPPGQWWVLGKYYCLIEFS